MYRIQNGTNTRTPVSRYCGEGTIRLTRMGYDVIMRAHFTMFTSGVVPPRVPLLLEIADELERYWKSFVEFEIFSQSPRLSMFLAGLEDT